MSAFTLQFARNLKSSAKSFKDLRSPHPAPHGKTRAKRNRANRPSLSRKRFDATEDRKLQSANLPNRILRSCIRSAPGDVPTKTEIVTALRKLYPTAFERHSSRLVPSRTL